METTKEEIAKNLLKTIAMLPNISTHERGMQIKKALMEAFDQGLTAGKDLGIKYVLDKLELEETNKWDDAIHCSCLPAVIDEIKQENPDIWK